MGRFQGFGEMFNWHTSYFKTQESPCICDVRNLFVLLTWGSLYFQKVHSVWGSQVLMTCKIDYIELFSHYQTTVSNLGYTGSLHSSYFTRNVVIFIKQTQNIKGQNSKFHRLKSSPWGLKKKGKKTKRFSPLKWRYPTAIWEWWSSSIQILDMHSTQQIQECQVWRHSCSLDMFNLV